MNKCNNETDIVCFVSFNNNYKKSTKGPESLTKQTESYNSFP